ncbi:hypothetical protein D9758_010783 [Tetrapyrgos nigripes]|uniref:DUF6699 domain-containing protein n=1 Tax=Tetrapyrgos nigripes TaxID=182062 RepID=A0A8H5D7Y2_9AGAR|nr:hypothetical protein D9758_010783 [Tetrapyrgos nigripes]
MQRPDGADGDFWSGQKVYPGPHYPNYSQYGQHCAPYPAQQPGPYTPVNVPGTMSWVTPLYLQNPATNNHPPPPPPANLATNTPISVHGTLSWVMPLYSATDGSSLPPPLAASAPPTPHNITFTPYSYNQAPLPALGDSAAVRKYRPHLFQQSDPAYNRGSKEVQPLNWRSDFRPTLCWRIASSLIYTSCLNRHKLVDFLMYKPPPYHNLLWDLRTYPINRRAVLHRSHTGLTKAEYYRPATEPPTKHMQIYHDNLPWYIDIWASEDGGVTVRDVVEQIAEFLNRIVLDTDYGGYFTQPEMMAIQNAAQTRGGYTQPRIPARVDFLLHEYMFLGLTKDKQGKWKMMTGASSGFLYH